MPKSVRGLTRIETLVILTAFGVLVALGLPTLARVRVTSGRTNCEANQRRMIQALQNYFSAFNNAQPLYACYLGSTIPGRSAYNWDAENHYAVALAPYLGIQELKDRKKSPDAQGQFEALSAATFSPAKGIQARNPLWCPSESLDAALWNQRFPGTEPKNPSTWPDFFTSYGAVAVNWDDRNSPYYPGSYVGTGYTCFTEGGTLKPGFEHLLGTTLHDLTRNPASTGVFGHMARQGKGGGPGLFTALNWPNAAAAGASASWPGNQYGYDFPNNHLGVLPVAFLDGHVEEFSRSQMLDASHDGANPSAPMPLWYYH